MSKDLNFDLKEILPKFKKLWQKFSTHATFIIAVVVLLVYLFVVWNIRTLATSEPSPEAESEALLTTKVSRIDKDAVLRIQSLEQNSSEVRSLFNEARNNPFHE